MTKWKLREKQDKKDNKKSWKEFVGSTPLHNSYANEKNKRNSDIRM